MRNSDVLFVLAEALPKLFDEDEDKLLKNHGQHHFDPNVVMRAIKLIVDGVEEYVGFEQINRGHWEDLQESMRRLIDNIQIMIDAYTVKEPR